jgi:hypothetical protein
MRSALLFLALAVPSLAGAKTIQLSCHETRDAARRWEVTLNEQNSTGSLVFVSDGRAWPNLPTVFLPDEVTLSQSPGDTFTINRTTLAFKRSFNGTDDPEAGGQCALSKPRPTKF